MLREETRGCRWMGERADWNEGKRQKGSGGRGGAATRPRRSAHASLRAPLGRQLRRLERIALPSASIDRERRVGRGGGGTVGQPMAAPWGQLPVRTAVALPRARVPVSGSGCATLATTSLPPSSV